MFSHNPLIKRIQVASNGTSQHHLGLFGPITHAPPGFLLVPKSSGEYRFFINLTKLNSFILAPRFHMTNHFYLASMLQPPAWLASLDLLDTYFHIPFRRSLHKYLAVLYAGDLSFFRAFPFDLTWPLTSSQGSFDFPSALFITKGYR